MFVCFGFLGLATQALTFHRYRDSKRGDGFAGQAFSEISSLISIDLKSERPSLTSASGE
jgi:hypothetical protein